MVAVPFVRRSRFLPMGLRLSSAPNRVPLGFTASVVPFEQTPEYRHWWWGAKYQWWDFDRRNKQRSGSWWIEQHLRRSLCFVIESCLLETQQEIPREPLRTVRLGPRRPVPLLTRRLNLLPVLEQPPPDLPQEPPIPPWTKSKSDQWSHWEPHRIPLWLCPDGKTIIRTQQGSNRLLKGELMNLCWDCGTLYASVIPSHKPTEIPPGHPPEEPSKKLSVTPTHQNQLSGWSSRIAEISEWGADLAPSTTPVPAPHSIPKFELENPWFEKISKSTFDAQKRTHLYSKKKRKRWWIARAANTIHKLNKCSRQEYEFFLP